MESDPLEDLISRHVAPYIQMIEQLRDKQREKDAEILVLRYALVEMDRKIQELERKNARIVPSKALKTTSGQQQQQRVTTTRTTVVNTPRSNSRQALANGIVSTIG